MNKHVLFQTHNKNKIEIDFIFSRVIFQVRYHFTAISNYTLENSNVIKIPNVIVQERVKKYCECDKHNQS